MIALSATRGGKKVFSVDEIKAMAAACETLMSVDVKGSVLYGVQKDFIESFARAAVAYFKANSGSPGAAPCQKSQP